MSSFVISQQYAGSRLDVFLTEVLGGQSRSQVQKMISNSQVTVNGKIIDSKNVKLLINDVVDVISNLVIKRADYIQPQDVPFDILYEDEHLVAVNKPAGIVVHPGNGVHDGTLVNGLMARLPSLADGFSSDRPGIVHRLDKETSGVLLVAKNNQIHALLASLFQNRQIEKNYLGFCFGVPNALHDIIDLPLDRNKREPLKRAPSVHGKESRTEYWVIEQKGAVSAIRFQPHTGRTHQIRVHCSSRGFPIIADTLYGGGKERVLKIAPLNRPFAYSIFKCFNRHALHAVSLSFTHPVLNEKIQIKAPMPDDFLKASVLFGNTFLLEK
jgi:23S rRNA pseudouridine1911/1915/1917 synthase